MSDRERWSDESRETSINGVLTSQKYADTGYWYVPYKTAIALEGTGSGTIMSHLGCESDYPIVDSFRFHKYNRAHLMTNGVYDCAALSIHTDDNLKVLLHAYGSLSLKALLLQVIEHYPTEFVYGQKGKNTKLELAYNPIHLLNACLYELTCFSFVRKHVPLAKINRRIVFPRSVVRV